MYNQVIYKGYGGDGTDPNDISPSILDVCNNHKRTTTLLNDLIFLSRSLYHTSMANSKNSHLFMKDGTNNNSDLDSDTDTIGDDDSDNDDTNRTILFKTKCKKERKALEQVVSDCHRTKKEPGTLGNIKSHKSNQEDVVEGVYGASKKEIDLLKVEQQKRHVIQNDYIYNADDANTFKDTVETVNDRVLKTTVGNVDTDTEKLLSDKRSATTTNDSNRQPMEKRQKQTAHRLLNRKKRLETCLSL